MKLQNLSTGEQDFANIRNSNRLYVDKTHFIHKLLHESNKNIFLSRPRRFGKSLFINTLKEVLLGNKQYFKGLFIEDKIEWKKYPVIHFDFSRMDFKSKGLVLAIQDTLERIGQEYGVSFTQSTIGSKFEELIHKLHAQTGEQVAILIDEYDKPITEYLEFEESAEESRNTLRTFYSILKGSSSHIRMVFITGISRFSKVSLFSELNNFTDLSFYDEYHNICGYTKEELESSFHGHLQAVAERQKISYEELIQKVREWYNGYSWNGIDRVYNPFSVLLFLDNKAFSNYWFESGTPKFLIKQLKPNFRYELSHTAASMATFNNYDITHLNIETLLFQTGYLTILEKDDLGDFILSYPNREVEQSMLQYLLMDYGQEATLPFLANNFIRSLRANDMERFIETVNVLFANIPAEIFIRKKEAFYHAILYISLKLCGFHISAEVRKSKGRLDAVLRVENRIYIFEFKLDSSAQEAMKQIHEKNYAKAYMTVGDGRDRPVHDHPVHDRPGSDRPAQEIYLIGINFSSEKKEVDGWVLEKM